MPYIHRKKYAGNTIEHKKYYSGRYKAKIKNSPPQKETPKNQKDYQDRKTANEVRGLIDENFWFGDYWVTFCYPAWYRPTKEEVRRDKDIFLERLARRYKKNGCVLKYIFTAGRGERGAIHFHFVLNGDISTAEISEVWWSVAGNEKNPYPRVNFRNIDKTGYQQKIADYLIKNSKETFWSGERIFGRRYCASYGSLRKPIVEKEIVSANTWREEPKAPQGYYLHKESFYSGIDEETGYLCQKYIFVKINSVDVDVPQNIKQPKRKYKKKWRGG